MSARRPARAEPHPVGAFNLRTIGDEPDGATPLDEDDIAGLIPDFVATRGDLNELEFENIAKAMPWALDQARRRGTERILSHEFVFALHKRMFEDVWTWAGAQRRRPTNIGVDPAQIVTQMMLTIDDAIWWHENDVFDIDERAARIHRRLVAVHPFRNGNGRCTRLIADLYLTSIDAPLFTWGAAGEITEVRETRRRYLEALHAADGDDYGPLVAFCRS
ncbi:MAG TPA: mobile mystery protein B [Iamia sp.]|nr:mobile mystery protein B [Iamia sp.]